jgi:16S rRNA C967 or C1407 C5-methylase (RsmB/RsmF family)
VGNRHGADAFDAFYGDLFGDRWPQLREALLDTNAAVEFSRNLAQPYFLDAASLAVAQALSAQPGHDVVDLCAAPGGKTLVIASGMDGRGSVTANERSAARRARLHRVLEAHLHPEQRCIIKVTGHDAARWALYHPQSADRVLADVPCSSERHILSSAGHLARWSRSRTRNLAHAAYAIACAAADTLRTGGLMVYSTCALSPLENDGVVRRLLERSGGALKAVCPGLATEAAAPLVWEPSEFGHSVLPDLSSGAGPMYFALLRK